MRVSIGEQVEECVAAGGDGGHGRLEQRPVLVCLQ